MSVPAAFIGHGSPMNTLEHNRWTDSWEQFSRSIDTPSAVLAISAHWLINATVVTSMARPRVIHDFYGFPQELFDFDYPVEGSPQLARRVAEIVEPVWVGLDDETWGIDHGTWSVLAHMFPNADIPVVQLAIDASKPIEYHVDLGSRLAALMDDNVLILASGNVVHNLRAVDWGLENQGFEWADRFDRDAREIMMSSPATFANLSESDDYRLAVPTSDHFLPLAYVAGICAVRTERPDIITDGCTMGALSMTSYRVGG